MTSASSDFEDGVRSARNLSPGPNGLQLATNGTGEAVFEVFTPWIIVPKVNKLDDPTDDTEASVVTLHTALPVTVVVSADQGKYPDTLQELVEKK